MRWWYTLVDGLVPVTVTVVIHGLGLLMLLINWNSVIPEYFETVKPTQVIKAKLVDQASIPKSKTKRSITDVIPNRPSTQELNQQSQQINTKPIETKVSAAKPVMPADTVTPSMKPKTDNSARRFTAEELAQLTKTNIDQSLAAEGESSEQDLTASFTALIRQTVVNYWSRPPSARNGMQTVLQLQLIPTGDIVGVTVVQSSGDPAFDRSAVNAVEKAARFPELQKLPPREFEKTFRRFKLLFKPEDLRY
ncbi:MAG: cell envelope integrity protein TolA [Halieaceae bacterium]|jgi:colicin import membrane protein|nr:cell envelope integrity protein TolA [Halieaceae bacterium]